MMTKPTSEQVTHTSGGLSSITQTVKSRLDETISVKDFGAVGDGVADDTAAIQAAIDWAMYRNLPFNTSRTWNVPCVFIPAGRYKISDTIHLGYGDTFRSVHLRGDGRMFIGEQGFAGTALIPTFNDRPAIAVSGGRSNSIQSLSIRGLNQSWVVTNKLGTTVAPLLDDLVAGNWVNSAFPASASSRYAPYAGIAIDPYAGTRPAVSYPDVNYPSWLNYTTQYQKNFSSDVTIRDVEITGFAVAVVVQPCDADGNGDFVKVEDALIGYCQYGISIGNTQARDCSINNVSVVQCYCFVTTTAHGRQNGKPGIDCRNCSFNFGIYVAIIQNMAFGNNVAFRNLYTECIYSVGIFGGGGGARQQSVLFGKCEFQFSSWQQRGIPAAVITALCPVIFDGCLFLPLKPVGMTFDPNMVCISAFATQTSIRNCYAICGEQAQTLYEKQAINATNGIVLTNLQTNLCEWSVRHGQLWDMSTGSIIPGVNPQHHETSVAYSRRTCIPVYAKHVYCNEWDYGVPLPRLGPTIFGKATMTSIAQSGRTVTADLTGHRDALALATVGGDVGDLVADSTTGTVFIVSSRTGTTIEMVAQNNLDKNGNLAVTITTATGNFSYLMCRAFALAQLHYGDLSSSSATISNVVCADGVSRNVNNATLGVQAGDYVITGNGVAIGISTPTNALISSVTSNSIVLSGNARYTATRERLTYFIKQATANNT